MVVQNLRERPDIDVYWKWATRGLGLVGFVALLAAFLLGRDIPTAFLVLVGGMVGLEPIVNWQRRSSNEGD